MKKLTATLLLVLTSSLFLQPVYAEKPPLAKSLAERVDLATHVFVGRAKRVRVMQVVNGRLMRLTPEPDHTGPGVVLELEVNVQEVLSPGKWVPPRVTKVMYGGGIFEIKRLRERFLAGSLVYLTREKSFAGQTYYFASYPWHLVEGLDKREEIRSIIEKRVAR